MLRVILSLTLCLLLAACSSPQEKAREFLQRAQQLAAAGNLVEAKLEYRNALQLDQGLAAAWYGLAQIARGESNWPETFAYLEKAIAADPAYLEAHIDKTRILVSAEQWEPALQASATAQQLAPEDPRVLALRAAIMYSLGDRELAVELARGALGFDPGNVDAHVVLATERLNDGDPQAALAQLEQGRRHTPDSVALQLITVEVLDRLDRADDAEQVLRELIAQHPESSAFQLILARFYLNQFRDDDAERIFRDIVSAAPTSLKARVDLVQFIRSTRGDAAALAELRQMIDADPATGELRFLLARLQYSAGDHEGATRTLRGIAADAGSKDERLRAKGLLAIALVEGGEPGAGQALVEEVLAEDPRNEQALIILASRQIDQRKLSEAISNLRTILKDSPDSARAMLLLGRAHEMAGAKDLAEDRYVEAFRAGKQSPEFGLPLAQFLSRTQQPQRAEQVLEEILLTHPAHLDTLVMLARARLASGDLAGAQGIAQQIRTLEGAEAQSNQIEGALYAARQDFEQSINAFKRAYATSPSPQRPMLSLVRTYLSAGRPDQAHEFLDSVLAASENNVAARLLKGQLYFSQGEDAAASEQFERVLAGDAGNVPAHQFLARVYQRNGDPAKALATLDQGLQRNPGNFSLRLTQAGILEEQRDYDAAIGVYEQLLAEQPAADVVANNLASLLAEHRDDPQSLARAHEIAQRFRNTTIPHFRDTLAWTYFRLGEAGSARAPLEQAVRDIPGKPLFRYHLARVYLALGETAAAQRELEQARAQAADTEPLLLQQVDAALQQLEQE
ncbi:tetratricopeptide repeat protein [Mangrovimicrobium sediminis]|uniref:Tetratricopeptide repeat protein n=1 Tax=Mangrovimicrobium sediminis TaxID=2562682 RepID=A0A4Z0M3L4_9GAMM|nr:tetratricopeptide repeat protein [Haliea sp. SAOS-164]TGD73958.1 tetratricopeptide repeat protein [Haliea sp. SAOS-164]